MAFILNIFLFKKALVRLESWELCSKIVSLYTITRPHLRLRQIRKMF